MTENLYLAFGMENCRKFLSCWEVNLEYRAILLFNKKINNEQRQTLCNFYTVFGDCNGGDTDSLNKFILRISEYKQFNFRSTFA